ncbi:MAG TPA: hypothetical protein VMH39_07575 [Gemmatimonadaceae bacterium]|nr:hypothetical protein [Gemmatimonadaceae bacterium]
MPIAIRSGAPTLFIRRAAFERANITRSELDASLGLTPDEFAVEGGLVAVGPLYGNDAFERAVVLLESRGLEVFSDFFELSGNVPDWIALFAMGR